MMGNPWMYFGCRCTQHIMGRGFTDGGLRFTGRKGWLKLVLGRSKEDSTIMEVGVQVYK
jgi:hypothetical protein